MTERSSKISFWQQMILFALGGFIGAFLVMLYLREQRRKRQQRLLNQGIDRQLAARPDHAIILPAPQSRAIEATHVPLALVANPEIFTRGEQGGIRAETLPGAQCSIEARYSTRRIPGSLSNLTTVANERGMCEWVWEVGTSGNYVDVSVTSSLKGYEDGKASLRVSIKE